MRRNLSFLALSIAILFLWTGGKSTFAQGGGPQEKITFEGFLFPDNVIVESTRTLTLCLVNQGLENELIRQGNQDDFLQLTIPKGSADSDLESDGSFSFIACTASTPNWDCQVLINPSAVEVTLGPFDESSVLVLESQTICFDLTGVQVNSEQGLSFSNLEQSINMQRANDLKERPLVVFKSEQGTIRHSELDGVQSDQHHVKTSGFFDLSGSATDDQIPNDIAIESADFATSAGNASTATSALSAANADLLDGLDSTAFESAGSHSIPTDNTLVGQGALQANTTGSFNTASGRDALASNTTGKGNTASGFHALLANTTGFENTASGFNALLSNSTGWWNTASGLNALVNNTSGFDNTATGAAALAFNTTGDKNTASGFNALYSNTTGNNNTASGFQALQQNTIGFENTAIGFHALQQTTGSNNTALGFQAGLNSTTGKSNIFVSNPGTASDDRTIRIGTEGVQTRTFMAGILGPALAGSPVVVDSFGRLGTRPFSALVGEIPFTALSGTATATQIPLAQSATTAGFATSAGTANTADFATNAGNAATADFATNATSALSATIANTLQGLGAFAFVRKPTFTIGWKVCIGLRLPIDYRDAIIVPDTWTKAICAAFVGGPNNPFPATNFQVGCLFENSFSVGSPGGNTPASDCGWEE